MTMKEKQLLDKNRGGFLATELVAGSVAIVTALGFANAINMQNIIKLIVCLVAMAVSAIAYKLMKSKYAYRHVAGLTMIIVYFVTLFTSENNNMYAICYAIAIMVMLFGDKIMVNLGASVAVVFLLIANITKVAKGRISLNDCIIQLMFTAVACLLAVIVVKVQIKHNKEDIDAVQAQADAQLQTSNKIVDLAAKLSQRFIDAKQVSDELNETMDVTHNSVNDIADSSKQTAEAVEQQTMQTSDIQEGIRQVGEQASYMGEISVRTSQVVDEGVGLIERLKVQAQDVANINLETRTTTDALNESIKDVQAITETILGISSQTNLLALNASIEAARAGEAGKGFAVVADEIRTLSESTREATEKISQIIERLTKDAERASKSMSQSADYAQMQNELIDETGEKLNNIKNDTDELNNSVHQVNDSVKNIIAANEVIMDSISNLSAQSQQVASTTESVLSISDSSMGALANMNDVLSDINSISLEMEEVAKQ